MSTTAEFVAQYTTSSREKIEFSWNGKHAAEFCDSNQEFRWEVIALCLSQVEHVSPLLLEHLFLADSEWAAEAWGSPHHFAQLGSALLERGQEAALDTFSIGFVRSFDTYGACHEVQISKPLLSRLISKANELLSQASEDNHRTRLESAMKLFEKLQNETATQGWAKVGPGTPVSNIRVVWPRWYHKLWAKLSQLLRRRAT